MNNTWESYKLDPYVTKMADLINIYQEKVDELIELLDKIEADMNALEKCQYTAQVVSGLLTSIQKAVDQLALGNYSNLHAWVETVDKQVRSDFPFITFSFRLNCAYLNVWMKLFDCGRLL